MVQGKYQSMRNLLSKDKNIGVGRQEEPSFVKVEKNLEKAVYYFTKCADKGNEDAM